MTALSQKIKVLSGLRLEEWKELSLGSKLKVTFRVLKDNRKQLFWCWVGYQTIKGLLWVPVIYCLGS